MNTIVNRSFLIGAFLGAAAITSFAQPPRLISGLANPEYTVANSDTSVAFYRDVIGLSIPPARGGGRAPGAPPAGGPPAGGAGRGPDPNAPSITGTPGARPHIVRLAVPGETWQLEDIEMTGIERKPTVFRRQDIGTAGLIFYVRDIDAMVTKLKAANAPIVTVGGAPLTIGGKGSKSRAIVARDPDGFYLEFRQMDPLPATTAPAESNVIGAGISVSIENTEKTAHYWRDLLDFDVKSDAKFSKDKTELALQGTAGAEIRKTTANLPGTKLVFEFLEFKGIDRKVLNPRIQDPGNGAYDLDTSDMAAFYKRLKDDGETKVLTSGGEPMNQGARIVLFYQDINGFILETAQATGRGRGPAAAATN